MRNGATEVWGIYHRSVTNSRARRGPGYPVRPNWQQDVLAQLKKLGLTEKELAKRVRCAQSTVYDTLHNVEARHSSLIPDIHAVIGWDPPPDPQGPVPLPSADAIELGHMFDRLPERVRQQMRDQARTYLELLATPEKKD